MGTASNKEPNADKLLYQKLRKLSWEELWNHEAQRFDGLSETERLKNVAVIRAVGVVFLESGPREDQDQVKAWLRRLLKDPAEKIRRYAMNALPKVGGGADEESELLSLLQNRPNEREVRFVTSALEKIGGAKTLAATQGILPRTEQRARASVVRSDSPGEIAMDSVLEDFRGVQIRLRGRRGLEGFVASEVAERVGKKFKIVERRAGSVLIEPMAPFCLSELYTMRCFGSLGFVLGSERNETAALSKLITSPLARRLFSQLTLGTPRYRMEFISRGHRRGAIKALAEAVYARCPDILNDPRSALWAVDFHPESAMESAELRPRLTPDPRFAYRLQDVPAASHPPLAACMARWGRQADVVWDPFCGSGAEIVESSLFCRPLRVFGTDRSAEAVEISRRNFSAARLGNIEAVFETCDFRDHHKVEGLKDSSVNLVITNPPLGMRVTVRNLSSLIEDLFDVAARVLRPGGRLVFVNPLRSPSRHRDFELSENQIVDMSGFDCRMECHIRKSPR